MIVLLVVLLFAPKLTWGAFDSFEATQDVDILNDVMGSDHCPVLLDMD